MALIRDKQLQLTPFDDSIDSLRTVKQKTVVTAPAAVKTPLLVQNNNLQILKNNLAYQETPKPLIVYETAQPTILHKTATIIPTPNITIDWKGKPEDYRPQKPDYQLPQKKEVKEPIVEQPEEIKTDDTISELYEQNKLVVWGIVALIAFIIIIR